MPQYRLTWAKVVDSEDFNELPDDTARVFWLILPVRLDRAGRCYDDPQWLRSMIFPKRRDISIQAVENIMDACEKRKMIVRYCVSGKKYFYVPSFKRYQRGTDKEAKSPIPAPCKKSSNSGPTPELVRSNSEIFAGNSVPDSDSKADADALQEGAAPPPPPAAPKGSIGSAKGKSAKVPETTKPERSEAAGIYHEHMKLWPNPDQAKMIDKRVADLPKWEMVLCAWRLRGYSPVNVDGMLDWYREGIPQSKAQGGKTNGTHSDPRVHPDSSTRAAYDKSRPKLKMAW